MIKRAFKSFFVFLRTKKARLTRTRLCIKDLTRLHFARDFEDFDFGIRVVGERQRVSIALGGVADDRAVAFNQHAVIIDGDHAEAVVVEIDEEGAIILHLVRGIADERTTEPELDRVDNKPVTQDEDRVSGEDGEAPHDEGFDEFVRNAVVDAIKPARGTEGAEATREKRGEGEAGSNNFE